VSSETKTIIFVCTGNAGRSQIAQSLFGRMADEEMEILSAGVDPWEHLHPVAERLLQERGVDTSRLHPKHVRTFLEAAIDWVVTIGDRAEAETPPFVTNPVRIHWEISDPADADGTGEEDAVFRRTMEAIEERLPDLLATVRAGRESADG
jgi:arsenate reductase